MAYNLFEPVQQRKPFVFVPFPNVVEFLQFVTIHFSPFVLYKLMFWVCLILHHRSFKLNLMLNNSVESGLHGNRGHDGSKGEQGAKGEKGETGLTG